MKMTAILIVVEAMEVGLDELLIRGGIETTHPTALLESRSKRRVLE